MFRPATSLVLLAFLLAAGNLPAQGPATPPTGQGYQPVGQPPAGPIGGQGYGPANGQPGAAHAGPTGPHQQPFSGPARPITPNTPAAQRVPRPPVMRNAPFQLTQQQINELMAVLSAWEQQSSKIDLLRCNIELLEYDLTFPVTVPSATPGQAAQVKPNNLWQGELRYQTPDKGWFEAATVAPDGNHREHKPLKQKWIVDGKSVYQFEFERDTKDGNMTGRGTVVRRDLPPQLQGAGIGDGPLPFFFGAKAKKLLHRYFMRLVTPANIADRQVWIEAYPRFQFDAANFRRATVILDRQSMMPWAVEVYSPSGNERSVHKFSNAQIGRNLLEKVFNQDLFKVSVPFGWQEVANPGANAPHSAGAGRKTQR